MVEGSLIPVYGEGDPEAQVPAVEAQAQVGADDTCKPKPKFRCSACGEYVSRHTDFLFEHDWCGEFRGKCGKCSIEAG